MLSKLNPTGKEKIKFFDSILYYLANNYSKEVTIEDIMSNIKYNDSRIKKLSAIDSFFEEDNVKQTYEKSLKLLSNSSYISNSLDKYTLTTIGLIITTSGGLISKEKREIRRYNFQNWIWVIAIATFIINVAFQIVSFSKSSVPCCTCSHNTNQKQKGTDTKYSQLQELKDK